MANTIACEIERSLSEPSTARRLSSAATLKKRCSTVEAVALGRATSTSTGSWEVALGQALDLVGEGGREQQRLALLGQVAEDALQVGQEADVEHAVGLVEHHVLDLVEHRVLRLDVVEQPARRGDQHLDAGLQLERLRLHVDAAEHSTTAARSLVNFEYCLTLLATWSASSRVGASTSARTGWRAGDMLRFSCLSIFCSSGIENAAVLPVPVCATPITSRPASTIGIALAWMGVMVW